MYYSREMCRRKERNGESMAEEDQEDRRSRLSCLSGPLIEKK